MLASKGSGRRKVITPQRQVRHDESDMAQLSSDFSKETPQKDEALNLYGQLSEVNSRSLVLV